jgi:hypothetical protein
MAKSRRPQTPQPESCPRGTGAAPGTPRSAAMLKRERDAQWSRAAELHRHCNGYHAAAVGLYYCAPTSIPGDIDKNPEFVVELVEWAGKAYLWSAGMGLADRWPAVLEAAHVEERAAIPERDCELVLCYALDLMSETAAGRWGAMRGVVEVLGRDGLAHPVIKVFHGACRTLSAVYKESLTPRVRQIEAETRAGKLPPVLCDCCHEISGLADLLEREGRLPRARVAPAEPPRKPEVPPPGAAVVPLAARYIDGDTFDTLGHYLGHDPDKLADITGRLRALADAPTAPAPSPGDPLPLAGRVRPSSAEGTGRWISCGQAEKLFLGENRGSLYRAAGRGKIRSIDDPDKGRLLDRDDLDSSTVSVMSVA